MYVLTEGAHIEKRKSELNIQWENLKKRTDNRRMTLEAAKEIHIFNRDANDALQRIQEKEKPLSSEDYGKDLSSVQALQKKHSGFEVSHRFRMILYRSLYCHFSA